MSAPITELPKDAILLVRGHVATDFDIGRIFEHSQRRTILESDNSLFTTLTLHYNPLYLDRDYALAAGYRDMPINPLLVFNMVFGISVEDLSEGGGPFLGIDDIEYDRPVYAGDTVRAQSTVIANRNSSKHENYAIVTWRTEGYSQSGERVISFQRSNLVKRSR